VHSQCMCTCLIETGLKVPPKRYESTHEDKFIEQYEGEHTKSTMKIMSTALTCGCWKSKCDNTQTCSKA